MTRKTQSIYLLVIGWVRNEDFDGPCCASQMPDEYADGLGNIYRDEHIGMGAQVFAVQLTPDTNYEVAGHFWGGPMTGMRRSNANKPDQGVTFNVPPGNPPSDEENTQNSR